LIVDLKEFNEVNNLILDGRWVPGNDAFIEKKDENNLLDAFRGLSKEGMLDFVDVVGL